MYVEKFKEIEGNKLCIIFISILMFVLFLSIRFILDVILYNWVFYYF